jgi:hypothetical protein
MSTLTATQLQQQYIAYFGRPGDPAGIKYWLSSTSGISSAREFADKIYAQDEYKTSTVGSKSTEAQVNSLYQNLFGREADASGLIYWTNQIESGILTLSNIAYDLIAAAGNPVAGNETQGAADALALNNKVAAATAFTADVEASTSAILAYQPETSTPWKTGAAFESGKSYLAGITATAHTDAGIDTAIATMITANTNAGSLAASTTLKFTTNTDALVGAGGNDIISGVYQDGGGTGTTIAPGDSVDGKAGTDTFTISVAGVNVSGANTDKTLSAVQTDGVEKLFISNFETSTGNNTFETGLMTGLTTLGVSASSDTGDTIFTNMKNFVDAEMRNGGGDLTLTYGGEQVVTGTADTQKLTVSSLTAGTFTAAGFETVNIHSELAKSTLAALTASELKTLNITGDKNLTITGALSYNGTPANGTAIDATIDASAFSGDLSLVLDGEAATLDVKGGSGSDSFNFDGTLTKNDVVDGGAGVDTVKIDTHDGEAATLKITDRKLTNVEVLEVEGTSNKNTSLNADGDTVTTYDLIENAITAHTATITNLAAGDSVSLTQSVAGTNNKKMGAVTLSLKDPSGTADSIDLSILGTSGHGADEEIASITVADVETINIKSTNDGTTAMLTTDENELASGVFNAATDINITGDANFTLTALTAAKVTTVDASALVGKLHFTANQTTDFTGGVKGGAKDDTFVFGTTLTAKDVIDGGADGSTTGDTLTATINALGDAVTSAALNIANVETIQLTTITAGSFIDGTGITGGKTIQLADTDSAAGLPVTFTNMPAGITYLLGGIAAETTLMYTGTLDISLADETGSDDTILLKTTDSDTDDDVNATIKTTSGNIETLSIEHNTDTTANNSAFTLTDAKVSKIIVTKGAIENDEIVALGTVNAATTTIDASTFDGLLTGTTGATADTITLKNGLAGNTIVTGDGADTVTILNCGAADPVDGGAGTDILNATLTGSFTEAFQNFETVNLTVGNNIQSTVTGANGKGIDVATTFTLKGGDGLSTFAYDFVSPASLTTIDMGDYTGKSSGLTFAASQLVNTMTITGGTGTDTVTATTNGDNAAVASMTGVEKIKLNVAGGNSTFDASKATGVTEISVDDDGTARVITLNKLEDATLIKVETGVTLTNVVLDQANKANADNTITVDVGTSIGTVNLDIADVETVTLKNSTAASTVDLAGLAMATTGKTNKLIVTGNQATTITTTNADTTTIDGSGMTTGGSIDQQARSATVASTYTGTLGNDTFIMKNSADVISGGGGTGDTLEIAQNLILGGIAIDLTQTGDQVTQYNGALNSPIQSGFESIDMSASTGAFGADVTANKVGGSFTLTANTDNFVGGAGIDLYTYTGGADAIDLVDDAVADNIIVNLASTVDQATNSQFTASNFTINEDILNVDKMGTGNINAEYSAAAGAAAIGTGGISGVVDTNDFIIVADGNTALGGVSITATTYTNMTTVATFFGAAVIEAVNEQYVFLVNDLAGDKAYLYDVDSSATIAAADIDLIGIISTASAIDADDCVIA